MAGKSELSRLSVVLGVVLLIMTMTVGIAAGATTLEVWMMETGNPDGAKAFFDAVNTEFEAAHPGVKVNLSWIPWPGAQQKFLTSITGGIAPDVAELGTTWTPDYAYMDAQEDLTERINALGYASEKDPSIANDPVLSVYADNLKYGRTYPAIHQWGQVENTKILLTAMQEILLDMGRAYARPAVLVLA